MSIADVSRRISELEAKQNEAKKFGGSKYRKIFSVEEGKELQALRQYRFLYRASRSQQGNEYVTNLLTRQPTPTYTTTNSKGEAVGISIAPSVAEQQNILAGETGIYKTSSGYMSISPSLVANKITPQPYGSTITFDTGSQRFIPENKVYGIPREDIKTTSNKNVYDGTGLVDLYTNYATKLRQEKNLNAGLLPLIPAGEYSLTKQQKETVKYAVGTALGGFGNIIDLGAETGRSYVRQGASSTATLFANFDNALLGGRYQQARQNKALAGLLPGRAALQGAGDIGFTIATAPRYLTGGQTAAFFGQLGGKVVKNEVLTTSDYFSAAAYGLPYGLGALKKGAQALKFTVKTEGQTYKLLPGLTEENIVAKEIIGTEKVSLYDAYTGFMSKPVRSPNVYAYTDEGFGFGRIDLGFTRQQALDTGIVTGFAGLTGYGLITGQADLEKDIIRPIGFGIKGGYDYTRGIGLISSLGKTKVEISRISTAKQLTGEVRYGTYQALGIKEGTAAQEVKIFKTSKYTINNQEFKLAQVGKLNKVFTAKPETFGKEYIIRVGTSELPSEYSAPIFDIEFLKSPNRQNSYYGFAGLEAPGTPSGVRTTVQGFTIPKQTTLTLQEVQAGTDLLFGKGFKVKGQYKDIVADINKNFGRGKVSVPRIKAELEGITGGKSTLLKTDYYTVVPSESKAASKSFFFRRGRQEAFGRVKKFSINEPSSFRIKNIIARGRGRKPGQFLDYGFARSEGFAVPIQEREYFALNKLPKLEEFNKVKQRPLIETTSSSKSSRGISLNFAGLTSITKSKSSTNSKISSSMPKSYTSISYGKISSSTSSGRSSISSFTSSISRTSSSTSSSYSKLYSASSTSSGSSSGRTTKTTISSLPYSIPSMKQTSIKPLRNIPLSKIKYSYKPSVEATFFNVRATQTNKTLAKTGLTLRPILRGRF